MKSTNIYNWCLGILAITLYAIGCTIAYHDEKRLEDANCAMVQDGYYPKELCKK